MRLCPFLMSNKSFYESVRIMRDYLKKEDVKLVEVEGYKKNLFSQFECPALTIGIDCPFHHKIEKENDQDLCLYLNATFSLTIMSPPPGIHQNLFPSIKM